MFWPLSWNLPVVVNSLSIWLARLLTLIPLLFASSLRASSYLLSILKVLVTGASSIFSIYSEAFIDLLLLIANE